MKREILGALIAVGLWLLVGGVFLLFQGIGEPTIYPVTTRGVIEPTSNLQYRLGGVLMIAGVVTLGGLLVVEVRNRKGGKL
jgi:uncharacterized membrane protein